jgi:hypothetical protein
MIKPPNNKIEATGDDLCDFFKWLVAPAPHLIRYTGQERRA